MTRAVLLAIKPKWADAIFDGRKEYEYRRAPPKSIDAPFRMVLYVTGRKELWGAVTVDEILSDPPEDLVDRTIDDVPHTPGSILGYFKGKAEGHALHVTERTRFKNLLDPVDFGLRGPQNFAYFPDEKVDWITNRGGEREV